MTIRCSISAECAKPAHHRGSCTVPMAERFWRNVVKADGDGCWVWRNATSYGHIAVAGRGSKQLYAHRVSYEMHFGAIPDGMFVCHHCDRPPCVRPDHLFLGTCKENVADMIRKGRAVRGPVVRGEDSPLAKLKETQVREILERYRRGEICRVIAADYGVSKSAVSMIVSGHNWAWLQ